MYKDRFHIIVSFRTDEITKQDFSTAVLFEELRDKMKGELHSNIIDLQRLSAEDIGKWIKIVRGITLPMIPDLQRIKENSAGLPMLLEEWIRSSKNFEDYENIHREELCNQITKLKNGLSEDIQKNISRLCILQQPFNDYEMLAEYLEMQEDPYKVQSLIEKLIENRVFYTLKNKSMTNNYTDSWFRHELIKRCLEDNLLNSISKHYHDKAAKFFIELQKRKIEGTSSEEEKQYYDNTIEISGGLRTQNGYKVSLSAAYHLHMSGKSPDESFKRNKEIGDYASQIGDLDLAERCYKSAIEDIKQLQRIKSKEEDKEVIDMQALKSREMWCLNAMAHNVYSTWGRYDEALSLYKSVLEYSKQSNNQEMNAAILNNISFICYNKGEYDQALDLYNQSLDISKKIGDQEGIATTLNNIALVHYSKGEYEDALYYVLQAHDILKRLNIPDFERSLDTISDIQKVIGKDAFDILEEKIRRKINNDG
jgi:tetratricopeptide (TPR) repeat protein